jgi:hypothetical protein
MFDSISKVENGPNIFSISKKPIQHTVKLLNLMRTKSKSNRMRETNHTNQSYVTSLVAFDSIFFWYALNSRVSLYLIKCLGVKYQSFFKILGKSLKRLLLIIQNPSIIFIQFQNRFIKTNSITEPVSVSNRYIGFATGLCKSI